MQYEKSKHLDVRLIKQKHAIKKKKKENLNYERQSACTILKTI